MTFLEVKWQVNGIALIIKLSQLKICCSRNTETFLKENWDTVHQIGVYSLVGASVIGIIWCFLGGLLSQLVWRYFALLLSSSIFQVFFCYDLEAYVIKKATDECRLAWNLVWRKELGLLTWQATASSALLPTRLKCSKTKRQSGYLISFESIQFCSA